MLARVVVAIALAAGVAHAQPVDDDCHAARVAAIHEALAIDNLDARHAALQRLPRCDGLGFVATGPRLLSAADRDLLRQGEITPNERVGAVAMNLFFGFGSGQVAQHRWSETGWIFTIGESVATLSFTIGLVKELEGLADLCFDFDETAPPSCPAPRHRASGGPYMLAGLIGLAAFRTASIIDAAWGPSRHNRHVRELKHRVGIPIVPIVAPSSTGSTAGIAVRF